MIDLLARRGWVPAGSEDLVQSMAERAVGLDGPSMQRHLTGLIEANRRIHDDECLNLNPATNTMSPAATAALASGLSTRTSLGYPGAKYEMGLEAIEEIEVIAAQLASAVFGASFVEFRVPSGAMANLMAFMACAEAGDAIIVPPATIGGHVTHHTAGVAGLYGLEIHEAPIDADSYSVDLEGLAALAERVRPKLITLGASLNLHHHDVAGTRSVADAVGAKLMFDAAHLSGPIAGGAWPNPLDGGADLMTMSTYKSLAGPTAGLVMTNDPALAERIDSIAFPGLTANFDVGKTAALALTLNDWLYFGKAYAAEMVASAASLADALVAEGVAVYRPGGLATQSHALALEVTHLGGGMATARRLRECNLLTSAIGLPTGEDDGLRIGTNEIVRWGAVAGDMAEIAALLARALAEESPDGRGAVAAEVSAFRQRFDQLAFVTS